MEIEKEFITDNNLIEVEYLEDNNGMSFLEVSSNCPYKIDDLIEIGHHVNKIVDSYDFVDENVKYKVKLFKDNIIVFGLTISSDDKLPSEVISYLAGLASEKRNIKIDSIELEW